MSTIGEAERFEPRVRELSPWGRLMVNRNWLALWFMAPAAFFLLMFLAWPLVLGVWLSFTDARLARPGQFVGLAETGVGSIGKVDAQVHASEGRLDVLGVTD